MLSNNDGAEIAERLQQHEKKSRINKIAPMSVDELPPGEFEERGREITPGVGISDRLEW